MRKFILGSGLAGICALVVLLALVMVSGRGPFAQAMGGDGSSPNVMAIDMNPADGVGNGQLNVFPYGTLGPINRCVQATVGTPFDFDVILDDVESGKDFSSQDFFVNWDGNKLGNPAFDHTQNLVLLGGVPQSVVFDSSVIDATAPPTWIHSVVMDTKVPAANFAEPAGSFGVLGRYTLTPQAAGAGKLTFITITDPNAILNDSSGLDWFDPSTDVGDQIWDATHSVVHGIVAIGAATCPSDTDLSITSYLPLVPITEAGVSTQPEETFDKVINNPGGIIPALVTKTVDIPDNYDTANYPMCEISYVCEDDEEIDVKAGVVYGPKISGICQATLTGPRLQLGRDVLRQSGASHGGRGDDQARPPRAASGGFAPVRDLRQALLRGQLPHLHLQRLYRACGDLGAGAPGLQPGRASGGRHQPGG